MIVEVIGPAGSGKTTFVQHIHAYQDAYDNGEIAAYRGLLHCPAVKVRFAWLLRRIPVTIAYKLRLTRITHLYRDQLLRSSYMDDLEDFMAHTLEAIHQLDVTSAEKLWFIDKYKDTLTDYILYNQPINRDRIIFIDEFLVQKILSFYFIHTPTTALNEPAKEYLRLVPKPAAIVFLDTDASIAGARVRERSKGRPHVLKQLSPEEFDATNERFRTVERNVCEYLNHTYGVTMIVKENNVQLASTLREISTLVDKRFLTTKP